MVEPRLGINDRPASPDPIVNLSSLRFEPIDDEPFPITITQGFSLVNDQVR